MKMLKKNKGVIVFYVLLIISTLVIINVNEQKNDITGNYVYLER